MKAAEVHFVIQKIVRYSGNMRRRLHKIAFRSVHPPAAGRHFGCRLEASPYCRHMVWTHGSHNSRAGNIVCECAGVFPQVFRRVRLGKWISQLTALSPLHRGNTGAALEKPEDGHNLITANTHTHTHSGYCGATLTLYIYIYIYMMLSQQNIDEVFLIF